MSARAAGLLAAGAGALGGSLFMTWAEPADMLVLFGAVKDADELFSQTGWELLEWSDWVLAALSAALLGAAGVLARGGRLPLPVLVPLALLCALGIASVVGHGLDPASEFGTGGRAVGAIRVEPRAGPWVAIAGLAAALAGLLAAGYAARRTRSAD